MEIIPSIDLLGGKVVRLLKGDYDKVTVYGHDPAELAATWKQSVKRLHVVDLEGARTGQTNPEQRALIQSITAAFGGGVQIGGGVRSLDTVEAYFDAGVSRVVLGTAAVKNPELVATCCRRFPGRIVVAVDARNGFVATDGWENTSTVRAVDIVHQFAAHGVAAVLYTDIDRDGTQVGPNVEATARLAAEGGVPVIASGGVGSLDHLRALARATPEIAGAIIGRALHEGRFTLLEAVEAVARASA